MLIWLISNCSLVFLSFQELAASDPASVSEQTEAFAVIPCQGGGHFSAGHSQLALTTLTPSLASFCSDSVEAERHAHSCLVGKAEVWVGLVPLGYLPPLSPGNTCRAGGFGGSCGAACAWRAADSLTAFPGSPIKCLPPYQRGLCFLQTELFPLPRPAPLTPLPVLRRKPAQLSCHF